MALGRKTGGRDWKPGQSGNPAGRPKRPFSIRLQRAIFNARWERYFYELFMDVDSHELRDIYQDKTQPPLRRAVAKYVNASYTNPTIFNSCLDRLVGKPSDGPRFAPSRDVGPEDTAAAAALAEREEAGGG